jgi:hypothetical protein
LQSLKELLSLIPADIDAEIKTVETSDIPGPEAAPEQKPDTSNPYPKVLDIKDTTISLLKNVPGTSNAQKTVNAAIVYLWAKKHIGIDNVQLSEIRDLCKTLSCFDQNNFLAYISAAREYFIVTGKRGSPDKICRITLP